MNRRQERKRLNNLLTKEQLAEVSRHATRVVWMNRMLVLRRTLLNRLWKSGPRFKGKDRLMLVARQLHLLFPQCFPTEEADMLELMEIARHRHELRRQNLIP